MFFKKFFKLTALVAALGSTSIMFTAPLSARVHNDISVSIYDCLKDNLSEAVNTDGKVAVLLATALILISRNRSTHLDSEVTFLLNNQDTVSELIEKKQIDDLADLIVDKTISWKPRLSLLSFGFLRGVLEEAGGFVERVLKDLSLAPERKKGFRENVLRLLDAFTHSNFLSQIMFTTIIGGGLLWKLLNRLDDQQAQKTARYLADNKKRFDGIISRYNKGKTPSTKLRIRKELKEFIAKSQGNIFKDVVSLLPGSSYLQGIRSKLSMSSRLESNAHATK